jgi:hypothetical protein
LGEFWLTPGLTADFFNLTPSEVDFFLRKSANWRFSHFGGRNSRDLTPQLAPRFSLSLTPETHFCGVRGG